jgi:hypothetical protein
MRSCIGECTYRRLDFKNYRRQHQCPVPDLRTYRLHGDRLMNSKILYFSAASAMLSCIPAVSYEYQTPQFSLKGLLPEQTANLPAGFPEFSSGDTLTDSLYKLAVSEACADITRDGYFCAGALWPSAWTRDMSYAVDLSLGIVLPATSRKSLETRIEHGLILQDTGTGGSWPVSTDRIIWGCAAYNTALLSGDKTFYRQVYDILAATVAQDYRTVYDPETGLFSGEESFLDWREQTYPAWMEPADIGNSFALGTNNVYYRVLGILKTMSEQLDIKDDTSSYTEKQKALGEAIRQHFSINGKSYFGAYIINGLYPELYAGYETLGESLTVLNSVVSGEQASAVLQSVIQGPYGTPVVAPQLDSIKPYHNDAVWPFVLGYRALAAKKAGLNDICEHEFAALMYAAARFGTFKENFTADTGSKYGTQVNSDRQLWSTAAYLAFIYRVICGLDFTEQGISISPLVFSSFQHGLSLTGLKIQNSILNLTITGTGSLVTAMSVNGRQVQPGSVIPWNSAPVVNIAVQMTEPEKPETTEKEPGKAFDSLAWAPPVPRLQLDDYINDNKDAVISWLAVPGLSYVLRRNRETVCTLQTDTTDSPASSCKVAYKRVLNDKFTKIGIQVPAEQFMTEYTVEASSTAVPVLPSNPVRIERGMGMRQQNTWFYEAERADATGGTVSADSSTEHTNARLTCGLDKSEYNEKGIVSLWGTKENDRLTFSVHVPAGTYAVDFRYKNDNGPVNTGEKCALRTLSIDGQRIKVILFPQRGSKTEWGFTVPVKLDLKKGKHSITLVSDTDSYSQHHVLSSITLDLMRVARLK